MRGLFFFLICASLIYPQKKLFEFKFDERLFISFAFLNAAGFNGEWNKDGMDPVRIEVRKYINEKADPEFLNELKEYTTQENIRDWTNYSAFALINNGPPDFNLSFDPKTSQIDSLTVAKYSGLKKYMREFYSRLNLNELWHKLKSLIEKENYAFEPYAQKAIDRITSYLKIDKNFFFRNGSKIYFQRVPLMSYYTAETLVVNGDIYIISGPMGGEPSESEFFHEALHHPIGEITRKYSDEIMKYSSINSLNKGELGYNSWESCFEESMVRAIDKILFGKCFGSSEKEVLVSIYNEYKIGFILTPFFYEEMKKFESSGKTFEDFFPGILKNLDFNREKNRLEEFKRNSESQSKN